jgi:hypothetical protein
MGIAVDMGAGNQSGINDEGHPANTKRVVELRGTPAELRELAKAARVRNNKSLADAIDAESGLSSKIGIFERNPKTTGAIIAVAAIGVGTGAFFGGRALIRKRREAKQLSTGRVMRMAPPPPAAAK